MKYSEMTKAQLISEQAKCREMYESYKSRNLKLNMARGKPSISQENTALELLDTVTSKTDRTTEEGIDILNYGCLEGLIECRKLFADMLEVPYEKVFIGGNSSLNLIYDYLTQCCVKGASDHTEPWLLQGDVKFLCPVPGYDRHFGIADYLGIKLINVPLTDNGPDMDVVEELVKDPKVKGMFCVPKYSNPTGAVYSDETVKRIAEMETAEDFRVIWDNAYCIHHLTGQHDDILDILDLCEKAGNPDRAVVFASTSKISFSGSGVAVFAANKDNFQWISKRIGNQTIGFDKINQLRHVRYFKDIDGLMSHMDDLATIITPKFEIVLDTFENELKSLDIAEWTKPRGGYFISLNVEEGCAKRVYNLCKDAGVTLTNCGATFPYGKDPKDENIRIAPSYPTTDELKTATDILVLSIKMATIEKILG